MYLAKAQDVHCCLSVLVIHILIRLANYFSFIARPKKVSCNLLADYVSFSTLYCTLIGCYSKSICFFCLFYGKALHLESTRDIFTGKSS